MGIRERLQSLLTLLPNGAMVTFSRTDLEDLLSTEVGPEAPTKEHADYSVTELAERFGRSRQAVRDWIKKGDLQAYRFRGREYRITRAALAAFEERQRNRGTRSGSTSRPPDLSAWRHEQTR